MREIDNARQVSGEPRRRWFYSEAMELLVWIDPGGAPVGFQLSYDKGAQERVLTWGEHRGFEHARVSEDEAAGKHKGTALLVSAPGFDAADIRARFSAEAASLPAEVSAFVAAKLADAVSDPRSPRGG